MKSGSPDASAPNGSPSGEAETAAFAALPLVEKFAVPAGVTAPELAVVMADGGRLQIRDEPGTGVAASPAAGVEAASVEAEEWVEESAAAARSGHWREDKIGLLLTMRSEATDTDPCPAIPASFLDVALPAAPAGLCMMMSD